MNQMADTLFEDEITVFPGKWCDQPFGGITLRAYIATAVLAQFAKEVSSAERAAEIAVSYADALIDELCL